MFSAVFTALLEYSAAVAGAFVLICFVLGHTWYTHFVATLSLEGLVAG